MVRRTERTHRIAVPLCAPTVTALRGRRVVNSRPATVSGRQAVVLLLKEVHHDIVVNAVAALARQQSL
jgi:hypothetical protein